MINVGNFSNLSCGPTRTLALEYLWPKIVFGSLYSFTFILAFVGNCLVLKVVLTCEHMQTVVNYFIGNLALSDILVCMASLWMTPSYVFMDRWVFGAFGCTFFGVAQGTTLFVSTFTLTAIAMQRYVEIVHPFKPKLPPRICALIIVSIWITSVLLTMPHAWALTLVYDPRCERFACKEIWPHASHQAAFGLLVLALHYGLPFSAISYCYLRVFLVVRRERLPATSRSEKRRLAEQTRKRRMNAMLVLMVCAFVLCWLPMDLVNLLRDVERSLIDPGMFTVLFLAVHWVAMTSTFWNPVIYAWLNENFRREFSRTLFISRCTQAPATTVGPSDEVNASRLRLRKASVDEKDTFQLGSLLSNNSDLTY